MKSLWYMIRANLRMNLRNRTALFWNLAFPILFIVLFGFLFSGDDIQLSVGIAGADSSELARQVTDRMDAADGFDVQTGSASEELDALGDGDRTVVVVFGEGSEPGRASADVYWDQSNPQIGTVALTAVRGFLQEANLAISDVAPPIEVHEQSVESDELTYIDFLVPGILAMALMNSGMVGLASAFVTYREKGILRRIRATPFPLSSFIAARIIAQLFTSVMQAVLLVGLGIILFDLNITGNILAVLLMVVLGSLAFLSLGFVISAFARNQETADSLANALTFPMLFLGGVFFPVDSAPEWLQPIMRIIPLRYLVDGLRDLMVQGATLPDIWLDIVVMAATGAVGFLLALRFFRWESNAA